MARVVMPLVFERVRRATEGLERGVGGARDRVSFEPGRFALEESCDEEGDGTRDVGFLLGVIAAARGVDLLLARREVGGLRGVVRWLCGASGNRIEPEASALPGIATKPGRGWEVPFIGGCLFLRASRRLGAGPLRWNLERDSQSVTLFLPRRQREIEDDLFLADLAPLVPGSAALAEDERCGFRWPNEWLEEVP